MKKKRQGTKAFCSGVLESGTFPVGLPFDLVGAAIPSALEAGGEEPVVGSSVCSLGGFVRSCFWLACESEPFVVFGPLLSALSTAAALSSSLDSMRESLSRLHNHGNNRFWRFRARVLDCANLVLQPLAVFEALEKPFSK